MRVVDDNTIEEILESCKSKASEELEDTRIEFKEYQSIHSLCSCKKLAEEVSALANYQGGAIIVGIKDSNNVKNKNWLSQLVGFEYGDVLEIQKRIKGKLKPYFDIHAEYLIFEDKNYLIIHVPYSRDTLISTSSGKICIRDGRDSRPMEPNEVQQAVNNLQNYDWSAGSLALNRSCLDDDSVKQAYQDYCIRKQYDEDSKPNIDAFLEAIGVTSNGCITKSGLLFLGKQQYIKEWLGTYEYRFSWKTRAGVLIINNVWEECIWKSLNIAKGEFHECNISVDIKFQGKTYKAPPLDENAFHEAFLNAIVHRDYSVDGMISIDFYCAKLTITNPGRFYGGVTSENITHHQPRHRNKSLAKLLMQFQLVDRAGMGVKRMGLGSLRYGREFPSFAESNNSIEVSMHAEYVLPGIFILVVADAEKYGITDLILLNSVYRKGVIPVKEARRRIQNLSSTDDWESLKESVERLEYIELCGTNDGIFVRVTPTWNNYFEVEKKLKLTRTSAKHVKLYDYLSKYEEASNDDITSLLGHKNSTHTSQFLRDAKYVKRTGKARSSRWLIA